MATKRRAFLLHLFGSVVIFFTIAVFMFVVWYPSPYDQLSGGRNLFLILFGVGLICGPMLMLLLYSTSKTRNAIWVDIALVLIIQLTALGYGLYVMYTVRPLYLVHEIDRFRVITKEDYGDIDVEKGIAQLNAAIRSKWYQGVITVGIRNPKNSKERQDVLLESSLGGRDYSQRLEFYVAYDANYRDKALARARPLKLFIDHYPLKRRDVESILAAVKISSNEALFLPVVHRQDWIAILDKSANILGFVQGDGFEVL